MCVTVSGKRLVNQPDSIKSVANRTETTHVLFGSYDLLALRNLNGQLARRTIELHFKRYDNRDETDVDIFLDILNQFQENIPMKETVDLIDNWQFIYSRCADCIGVLKEWLNRSLSMALDENSSALTIDHLTASALTTSQSERLLDEVLAGEKKIEEEITQENLMSRYNFVTVKKRNGDKRKMEVKKSSGRVGVRNPKRDRVGI